MTGDVHRAAAEGFTAGAAAYERARPDYPQAAIDQLVDRLGIGPNATVLDLGAGTGKLTRQIVRTGATVIAVEPVAAMREQLVAAVPGVEAIDCTAEAISWPDGDADAVVSGQAFHWFDATRTLMELHRVLRPGGGVGLVWNDRPADAWTMRLNELLAPFEGDAPRERWRVWRDPFDASRLFTPLEEFTCSHDQWLDHVGMLDRVASMSFIGMQPAEVKQRVLDDVARLVAELDDPFCITHRTRVYTCKKR